MSNFNVDFYSNQKLMVIPQDPDMVEKLLSIDRKTREDVGAKFGIMSNMDWQMNTVANVAFEAILQSLAINCQVEGGAIAAFNFYNCFFVRTSYRKREDADKEGNINVLFSPGPRATELISRTEKEPLGEPHAPEEIYGWKNQDMPNAEDIDEIYRKIDRAARYTLSQKYRFVFPDDMYFASFAVLDTFFMNLFEYMLYELGHDEGLTSSEVNFNDNVEFHAIRKKEGVVFTMRPGMNAKLIIKSDETTEDERGVYGEA